MAELKQFVEFITKGLVDSPEQVRVEETVENNVMVITVYVADGDMGRVIGKDGHIVKSIRALVYALASRQGKKVNLKIGERK